MRKRERNITETAGKFDYYSYNGAGLLLNQLHSQYTSSSTSETMYDVVTPEYKKLSAEGALIINPLIRQIYRFSEDSVPQQTMRLIVGGDRSVYSGLFTAFRMASNPPITSSTQEFRDRLQSDIYQMIEDVKREAISKIDQTPYAFLEDAAELRSTLATLSNPLASAKKAAQHFYRKTDDRVGYYLKRKNVRRVEALSRAAGDAWLSSRYEFRPILHTIKDVYLGLPKIRARRSKRMRASSFSSYTNSKSGVYPTSVSHVTYPYRLSTTCEIKVIIYYEMLNPIDYRDWDLGVRLKDTPATVWALMPYSWLIDKFVDVSSTIKGLTNLSDPRLNILGGCYVVDRVDEQSIQAVMNATAGWSGFVTGGMQNSYYKYVTRDNYIPKMSDTLPNFTVKEALSDPSNLLDIASVTLQKLTFGGRLAHVKLK